MTSPDASAQQHSSSLSTPDDSPSYGRALSAAQASHPRRDADSPRGSTRAESRRRPLRALTGHLQRSAPRIRGGQRRASRRLEGQLSADAEQRGYSRITLLAPQSLEGAESSLRQLARSLRRAAADLGFTASLALRCWTEAGLRRSERRLSYKSSASSLLSWMLDPPAPGLHDSSRAQRTRRPDRSELCLLLLRSPLAPWPLGLPLPPASLPPRQRLILLLAEEQFSWGETAPWIRQGGEA